MTRALIVVFERSVLAKSIVKEETSTSDREALDEEKIELIKKAYFVRFEIKEKDQTTKWQWAKTILNRKCYDSAKPSTNEEKIQALLAKQQKK